MISILDKKKIHSEDSENEEYLSDNLEFCSDSSDDEIELESISEETEEETVSQHSISSESDGEWI
jgi:hypothetical protein